MRPLDENDPRQLGPYVIEQFIGKGGMGRVYLGRSPTGELVAVKIMKDLDDAQARKRFQREFELAKRVRSHYIAEMYDSGVYRGTPWYASEFIPGPTLQEAIQQTGGHGLGESAALTIALALCRALDAIHEQRIVHRDLKPGNIILSVNGPQVIDFGIAHAHGHTLTDSLLFATPGFIAPERFKGGAPERSWDVFALGVIVAYAATGRMPFTIESPVQNMRAVLDLSPALDGLPASLESFVRRCLHKDPAMRPDVRTVEAELNERLKDNIRDVRWLPDYVATEVLAETKRYSTEPYTPTRPYTRNPAPATVKEREPKVPRIRGAQPQSDPRGSTVHSGSGHRGRNWLLGIGGLVTAVAVVVWVLSADGLPGSNIFTRANIAYFSAGTLPSKAYDRDAPNESFTIKSVTNFVRSNDRPGKGLTNELQISTESRPGYVAAKVLASWCINVQLGKRSIHLPIDSLVTDESGDALSKNTLTVDMRFSGVYSVLPYCDPTRSKEAAVIGTVDANNLLEARDSDGEYVAVASAVRDELDTSNVIVAMSYVHASRSNVCVRTATGLVSPDRVRERDLSNVTYTLLMYKDLPPGSTLYLAPCSKVTSTYKGSSVKLP